MRQDWTWAGRVDRFRPLLAGTSTVAGPGPDAVTPTA
jgi:hypothetical protein